MNVAGVTLIADLSGALFWEEESLLVVSDLHLEKGSSFATRGVLLPPYDTVATLGRLGAVIAPRAITIRLCRPISAAWSLRKLRLARSRFVTSRPARPVKSPVTCIRKRAFLHADARWSGAALPATASAR